MGSSERRKPSLLLTIVLCLALIGLDKITKILAVNVLMPVGVIPAISGVFEWKYIENTGAAFGLLSGRQPFLIVVTGVALLAVALLLLFRRPKDKLEYISIILIFSGGVGNLLDRIAQGYVVDFINLLFINFAVFNLADIFVTVGFVLLVIAVFRSESRKKKQEETAGEQPEKASPPATDSDESN
ncbi:signal peptidase II [Ruminococcaceae bacterium OttesenSCG-928-I18]|nr:signal peptidase II [Ruminococcaceae bacterium OttesenSCG-928-I18]